MTVFDRGAIYIERIGQFLEGHNGAVTAIATVFIALFTIVLAVVTRRQARLTGKAATIAERALTELERPYVVVDIPKAAIDVSVSGEKFTFVSGKPIWEASNYGRTPAILIDRLTVWQVEAGSAMPYSINPVSQRGPSFPNGCIAGNNGQVPYQETANLIVEANVQNLLPFGSWQTHRLFFIGYLRYGDLFGGQYVNGFCLVFDPYGNRFVRIGDNEYNYTRTEKQSGDPG